MDYKQELDGLLEQTHALLGEQPISEYDLINQLQRQGYFGFMDKRPAPSHVLFCAHFLLFHVLYLLRERLWKTEQGHLKISPLAIVLLGYQPGEAQLSELDSLRDYYLDLEQLRTTSEEDVEGLLDSFWNEMTKRDQRGEALAVLGLSDPVSEQQIRQRYKQLVMAHHPDRGGDGQMLQQLNQAMSQLSS